MSHECAENPAVENNTESLQTFEYSNYAGLHSLGYQFRNNNKGWQVEQCLVRWIEDQSLGSHEVERGKTKSYALYEKHIETSVDDVASKRDPDQCFNFFVLEIQWINNSNSKYTAKDNNLNRSIEGCVEIIIVVKIVFEAGRQ